MAHNSTANPGSGGDTFTTVDLALATFPSTGKLPASCLYVSANTSTAPTPVTAANGLYVQPGTSTTWAATQSGTWNITNISGTISLPTGASTAANQTTANSSLSSIDGKITACNTGAVVVSSSALPSGAATAANQTTIIGHVDGIETLLAGTLTVGTHAVTQSGTWTVQPGNTANTTAWLVTGTGGTFPVTGTFWQATQPVSLASVPSHAVTNAGTFAVQAAQSGTWTVDLGTAAVTNAGTFVVQENGAALTSLQLLDDAVATLGTTTYTETTTKGFTIGAVRRDADTTLVNTTNEIGPLQMDANGRLKVEVFDGGDSHTVDNNGTFVIQIDGTALTYLNTLQSSIHAAGAAVAEEGIAALTENEGGSYARLKSDGNGNLKVVGTTAHDTAVAYAPNLTGGYASAAAPTNVSADGDVVNSWHLRSGAYVTQPTYAGVLAVAGNGASGTGVQRVTIANDSTGIISLTTSTASIGKLASNTGVTIGAVEIAAAQTLATVTTVSTVTTCSTVTTLSGGGVAHDGIDSGNPHKIGAKATTALSGKTLVADNDRSDLFCAADGVLIVRDHCLEDVVQERTTNTDGASTAFASGLAAPGSGIRLWIKNVTVCNSSATFCTVDLRDGSGGSVLWTLPVPATGGVTHTFNPPLKLTANTALAFDASAATTTLTISANGFKSKL